MRSAKLGLVYFALGWTEGSCLLPLVCRSPDDECLKNLTNKINLRIFHLYNY